MIIGEPVVLLSTADGHRHSYGQEQVGRDPSTAYCGFRAALGELTSDAIGPLCPRCSLLTTGMIVAARHEALRATWPLVVPAAGDENRESR